VNEAALVFADDDALAAASPMRESEGEMGEIMKMSGGTNKPLTFNPFASHALQTRRKRALKAGEKIPAEAG
jgi:hypothetical protein